MKRQEAGFGIVEIVVAIVLLGAVSIGMVTMFRNILSIQSAAEYRKSATLAAQREIEALRNSNYNQLTAGETITFTTDLPAGLPSPKSGQAVISEPVAGLKRVDVTVAYQYHGQTQQVKVSSMIGVIGITQ